MLLLLLLLPCASPGAPGPQPPITSREKEVLDVSIRRLSAAAMAELYDIGGPLAPVLIMLLMLLALALALALALTLVLVLDAPSAARAARPPSPLMPVVVVVVGPVVLLEEARVTLRICRVLKYIRGMGR